MIYNEDELKREILILNETVKAQTNYISDFKLELEAEYKRGQEDVLSRTCEGCKYWCKEKGCDLTYWQDYSHGYGFESEADDYCSRWEQK